MLGFMTCCLAALINKCTTFSFPVTLVNPGLDRAHQQKARISEVMQNCCSVSVSSTCGKQALLESFVTFAVKSVKKKEGMEAGKFRDKPVVLNCHLCGKGVELVPGL